MLAYRHAALAPGVHAMAMIRPVMLILVAALALAASGCGASRSFGRGESASRIGDWDAAVEHYRRAVQESPDRNDYKTSRSRRDASTVASAPEPGAVVRGAREFEAALPRSTAPTSHSSIRRTAARRKVTDRRAPIRDQYEAQREQHRATARTAGATGRPSRIK